MTNISIIDPRTMKSWFNGIWVRACKMQVNDYPDFQMKLGYALKMFNEYHKKQVEDYLAEVEQRLSTTPYLNPAPTPWTKINGTPAIKIGQTQGLINTALWLTAEDILKGLFICAETGGYKTSFCLSTIIPQIMNSLKSRLLIFDSIKRDYRHLVKRYRGKVLFIKVQEDGFFNLLNLVGQHVSHETKINRFLQDLAFFTVTGGPTCVILREAAGILRKRQENFSMIELLKFIQAPGNELYISKKEYQASAIDKVQSLISNFPKSASIRAGLKIDNLLDEWPCVILDMGMMDPCFEAFFCSLIAGNLLNSNINKGQMFGRSDNVTTYILFEESSRIFKKEYFS